MNPARTFGPNLVATDFTSYWVYVAGPLVGAVLAVGAAWVLRGPGGGRAGSGAAQGTLFTKVEHPDKGEGEIGGDKGVSVMSAIRPLHRFVRCSDMSGVG